MELALKFAIGSHYKSIRIFAAFMDDRVDLGSISHGLQSHGRL